MRDAGLTFSRFAALSAATLATAALAGLVLPGAIDMKANTAVSVLSIAAASLVFSSTRFRARRFLAIVLFPALLLGALTLAQYVFGVDFGIDEWIVADKSVSSVVPGRMGSGTSFALLLLCASLLVLASPKAETFVAWMIAGTAALLASFGLVAYLLGVAGVGPALVSYMPAPTAGAIVLLALSVVTSSEWPAFAAPKRVSMAHLMIALTLLVAGLGITLGASQFARRAADENRAAQFERLVDDLRAQIAQQMAKNDMALRMTAALFVASRAVESDEWDRYINALDSRQALVGLQGFAYARLRVEGSTLRAPIELLGGYASDPKLKGFDLLSDPDRRRAIEAAVERVDTSVVGPVLLLQDQERGLDVRRTPGFIMAHPIFAQGRSVPAQEKGALGSGDFDGVVLAGFHARAFFDRAFGSSERLVELAVFADQQSTTQDRVVLYASSASVLAPLPRILARGLNREVQLDTFGQRWTASFIPTPAFLATTRDLTPQALLISGTAISMLVFGLALATLGARARAEALADERTAQLRGANQRLVEFAHVVSHDLRAPLRHVRGFVGLLGTEIKDVASPQAKEWMRFITDAAARMTQLMDDLLRYARLGRDALVPESVDLQRIGVELQARAKALRPDAELHIGHLPSVQGSATQLAQVLANLVENALKFSPPDRPAVVSLDAVDGGTSWQIRVSDRGPGVPVEHRERIFEPFQRLHRVEDVPGTGIGLAITRRVAELHSATIHVEDNPGGGARFIFTLPKAVHFGSTT